MSLVFLCGPLGEAGLASVVLGVEQPGPSDAILPDHALQGLAGAEHAVAIPALGQTAPGLLTRADDSALARLTYYLAVYGLTLTEVTLSGDAVLTPAPEDQSEAQAEAQAEALTWPGLSPLQRDALIEAARDIMAHRAQYSARDLARRMGSLRGRAVHWAQSRARAPQGAEDVDRDVILHVDHRPYLNYFATREADLQFRRRDGSMSRVVNRGALMMAEAAAVLPYDPVQDAVLLIRQFRAPLYMGGSRDPWICEPVAGMVDPGETAEDAARREAMEEAGLTLTHLDLMGPTHASPGCLSDRLVCFIGLTDLTDLAEGGGVDSEEEDIAREILPFDDLMAGIDAGRYPCLPLITLGLWLARHRDRLRKLV